MSTFDQEDRRLQDTTWALEKVDLEREKRTIGFERRNLSADRRPTTGAAWGYAPEDR